MHNQEAKASIDRLGYEERKLVIATHNTRIPSKRANVDKTTHEKHTRAELQSKGRNPGVHSGLFWNNVHSQSR